MKAIYLGEKQIENIRSTIDFIENKTLYKIIEMLCSANQIYSFEPLITDLGYHHLD
ncbi:hypothetical protein [Neobacillus cucumis]|uniref:hypothetical protein n=1 Tax=Neobacillus cucumis TaxID=1740721 RepID=UPI00285363D4|nr:hypothetical protein [Neobacillus cucumis]MDR4946544.1 hypothetical protein [Neobacillus cucumis]